MRCLVALGLLACLATPAAAQRLPRIVVPDHYDLHLTPDLATGALTGRETIAVRLLEPASVITLHAVDLEIREAAVVAGGTRHPATVSLDASKETVTLTLGAPVPAGEARIEVAFTGRIRDDLRGLYRTRTDRRAYIATQFQATYARRAFPCFDEPALKATFDLTVVVDEGDTAISNGKIVSDTPGPLPGKRTIRFSTSPKMSTYLVALAVGDFRCLEGGADGTPIRVCAVPEKKDLGALALRAAETILPFFNRYYGIRYPFGKLDMVALPDYEWGGMENTASIFYKERSLLVHEKTASVAARRGVANIVSHEIAHQWFGDLVTLAWWDNVWLNEGFATWVAFKPLPVWDPDYDPSVREAQSTMGVLGADSILATRPIRKNGETPAEINELFDGIAYQKGSALLRMLESYVGPEVFREGINAYLRKHANGNATAEDFWSELTRVSGKPVDRIMASFVDQPGAPLVSVETRCEEGSTRITLSQQRFFADTKLLAAGSPEVWTLPVCFRRPGEAGASHCELLTGRSQTLTLDGCSPCIFLNSGARGYYRSAYTAEDLREIAAVAGTDLSPAERIVFASDLWSAVDTGRADVADYLRLAEGLKDERELAVLEILLLRLQTIRTVLTEGRDRERYDAWLRNLLRPAARELGWTPAADEPDDRRALRALILGTLGDTGDPDTIAHARRLVDRYLQDPAAVDPSLAGIAFGLAAGHGDAALYDTFLAKKDAAKTPEQHDLYFYSLTQFEDEALIRRNLDLILSGKLRDQDLPSFLASLLGNPASRSQTWAFLKASWPALRGKVVTFGGSGAIPALGNFCDETAARDIESFFQENRAPGAERAVRGSLEAIRNCVELKKLQGEGMRRWMENAGRESGDRSGEG
jgi:aminopeptidase N